jgi:hypothetical protein
MKVRSNFAFCSRVIRACRGLEKKIMKIFGKRRKDSEKLFPSKKFVFDFAAKKTLKIDYFTLFRSSEPVFNFFQGPDSLQKKKKLSVPVIRSMVI